MHLDNNEFVSTELFLILDRFDQVWFGLFYLWGIQFFQVCLSINVNNHTDDD